ncbi:MAG: tRNA 4-thiouridine(8) synthase ThiI [Clostridiales bacterium]|nr:tRNA 4-thiouridine(8) synthase ThiI [Clostridiales bacterium]
MKELLLVRYGEIFLKGLNRPYFIRALVRKIRYALRGTGSSVQVHDGRILVEGFEDLELVIDRVTRVFGVHSVCPAVEMPKEDFDALCVQAVRMTEGLRGTFKVNARRSDKRYPMNSPEINAEMGGRILEANPELRVDVHTPEHVLNVEIRDQAYLYVRVIPAVGGMPVGTNGNATLLLSGGIDSPVAGWMIAKRGVQINAVHFHSYPYTSEQAKEKVLDLARKLSYSCCGLKVHIVPFTDIQLAIRDHCPEEYTTLIMRRFMMRIAERIAVETESGGLITGESIGQVASQTMEALGATNCVVHMPVFRPLIGFDKSEIIDIAKKIDTYDLSSLPYEDCCTIFTPKHPVTRPRLEKVEEAEARIPGADALTEAALAGVEVVSV